MIGTRNEPTLVQVYAFAFNDASSIIPGCFFWISIRITGLLRTCRERIRWAKGLRVLSVPIKQIVRVSYRLTIPCSRIWLLSWLAECTLLLIGLH